MSHRRRNRRHERTGRGDGSPVRAPIPILSPGPAARDVVVVIGLVLAVALVFFQTSTFEFVTYDDPDYVVENPMVANGLTVDGVEWALTSFHARNWHPLTWISHMVDSEIHGLDPGGHHLTNVILHGMSTVLLYLALTRMTGTAWPSALVAALFAIHPLRAESVAWVSERKDVLSVMLAMAVLLIWSWYVKRPGPWRYAVAATVLALGLMAKPMLVTLPFVLLLLDLWPLRRLRFRDATRGVLGTVDPRSVLVLVLEKLPMIALALASSAVTVLAQREALGSLQELPFATRLGNALVSWFAYIAKSLVPTGLAVFYPHPADGVPLWQPVVCGLLLAAVTAVVVRQLRQRPYLTVGWLWYLGTLLPVIGLVQVGSQAMADRYTYLPQIGLWIMLAWGLAELLEARPQLRLGVGIASAVVLVLLAVLCWRQTATWKDSGSLYRRALAVTQDNWVAHANYSEILMEQGRLEDAVRHAARSLEINPDNHVAAIQLGKAMSMAGRPQEAVAAFSLAQELRPDSTLVRFNLGNAYRDTGNGDRAMALYREVLADDPRFVPARNNLGVELIRRRQLEAAADVLCVLELVGTQDLNLHFNCGLASLHLGRFAPAVRRFRMATTIDPSHAASWRGLTRALVGMNEPVQAEQALDRALRLEPTNPKNLHLKRSLEASRGTTAIVGDDPAL